MKRSSPRLNQTELLALHFLWMKEYTDEKDYWTYASDPKLLKFSGKSRWQLQRALRSLERNWQILESTCKEDLRGTPVFYHIPYPHFKKVKKLLKLNGRIIEQYILEYIRRTHNPMPTWKLACVFNLKKRTIQRLTKHLKEEGLLQTSMTVRRRKNGHYRAYPTLSLTKGQKPITHWMEKKMLNCSKCQYFNGENYCSLHRFSVNPDDEACSYGRDESGSEHFILEEELPLAKEEEGGAVVEMEDKI